MTIPPAALYPLYHLFPLYHPFLRLATYSTPTTPVLGWTGTGLGQLSLPVAA